MSTPNEDYRAKPLSVLKTYCQQETTRYLQNQSFDPKWCFEIWRRALQGRDEAAWAEVYEIYASFVRTNLHKHVNRRPKIRFDEEFLLNGVFIRIYKYVTPAKFDNFENLSRLLAYLKMCCLTEVLEELRQHEKAAQDLPFDVGVPEKEESHEINPAELLADPTTVEKEAISLADREHFWQLIERHLKTPEEKIYVYARFVVELDPREIAEIYPQMFPDVNAVYRCDKNIKNRLRGDPELRRWFEDIIG